MTYPSVQYPLIAARVVSSKVAETEEVTEAVLVAVLEVTEVAVAVKEALVGVVVPAGTTELAAEGWDAKNRGTGQGSSGGKKTGAAKAAATYEAGMFSHIEKA